MRWIFTVVLVVLCSGTIFAQPDIGNKILKGGPLEHSRVRHLLTTQYPDLAPRLLAYVSERWPTLPTQLALTRIQVLREHLPREAVSQIMEDIHARHPHLVTKTVLAYWTLAAEDDAIPRLMQARRREIRREVSTLIADRYPHLLEDFVDVVKTHDPTLPSTVRKEIAAVVHSTDPKLRTDLGRDLAALLARHPSVLLDVLTRSRLEVLSANPRFALELWTMLDAKYADRLYAVALAVVREVGGKHDWGALADRELRMVDAKYPHLAFDVANILVATRLHSSDAFLTSLAQRMQALHGSLATDFIDSLDRHAPGLRTACRSAMQAKFGEVQASVRAYVEKTFPDLLPQLQQL